MAVRVGGCHNGPPVPHGCQAKWYAGRPRKRTAPAGASRFVRRLSAVLERWNSRLARIPLPDQSSKSAGTFPPFSASFRITCLCSQMFIGAVSFRSPV